MTKIRATPVTHEGVQAMRIVITDGVRFNEVIVHMSMHEWSRMVGKMGTNVDVMKLEMS